MCTGPLKAAKLSSIAARTYLGDLTIENIRKVVQSHSLNEELDGLIAKDGETEVLNLALKDQDTLKKHHWQLLSLLDDAYLHSDLTRKHYYTTGKYEVENGQHPNNTTAQS